MRLYASHLDRIYRLDPEGASEELAGGWPLVRQLVVGPEGLFILQAGQIHILTDEGEDRLHSRGWEGAEAMVRAGDAIYVVHGARLYRLTETKHEIVEEGWYGTEAVAGSPGGDLVSVSNGIYYRGKPGAMENLSQGWASVQGLCTVGERPFLIAGGILYELEGNGYRALGPGWHSVEGIAGGEDGFYAVSQGVLYRVSVAGEWEALSDEWLGCRALAGWA